jgi:hypothetical protein
MDFDAIAKSTIYAFRNARSESALPNRAPKAPRNRAPLRVAANQVEIARRG